MGNSYSDIKNKKLYELIMPGTHDAITYKFERFATGPALDEISSCVGMLDKLFCCFCFVCNGCKSKTVAEFGA
jgi:hypothetical protein